MPTLTEGQTLFVIDLDYLVPIEQVEPHIDAHMAFIDAGYAAGHFLASGPKIPRKGGIVLARGTDVAEVEALMATDPFTVAGVTRVTVTPFVARRLDPALTGAAPT